MLQPVYLGRTLITNPDRFFAELFQRNVDLRVPFMIVLIGATVSASSAAMMYYRFGAAAADIAIGLIALFIVWFLCAGVFYTVSTFLGGEGSFKRVLEFTGYGFIPRIPSAIFNAVIIHTLLPLLASLPHFVTYAIAIIGFLFTLWSVIIWIFAVKHARNLSTNDALTTVVGSVVVGGLLLLFAAFAFSPLL